MHSTITIQVPSTRSITLPSYYNKAAMATYIYHEGQIQYRLDVLGWAADQFVPLKNTLNYSLERRSPEEQIEYLKGLAKLVEDSIKGTSSKKKAPVKRSRKK